jgi:hypothetical protein
MQRVADNIYIIQLPEQGHTDKMYFQCIRQHNVPKIVFPQMEAGADFKL